MAPLPCSLRQVELLKPITLILGNQSLMPLNKPASQDFQDKALVAPFEILGL
jgi:hypothetical protein